MTSKRTVLITGCSEGGLGDALARAFHAANFYVLASARNPAKMAHFVDLGIDTVALDVQSTDSIDAAVATVSRLTDGKLDILVNNSGLGYMIPVVDADVSRVRELFDVNVVSNIAVTQAFLPLLLRAAPDSMVVNNTSIASIMTVSLQGIYSATKAAMAAINDALRVELAPFGVKVVELKTGTVSSRFFENTTKVAAGRLPENSYYELARDVIEDKMSGRELMKGAADPDQWAKGVVADLSKMYPPKVIWRGSSSLMAWFVKKFLPHTFTDLPSSMVGGMNVFRTRLQGQKKLT